MSQNVKRIVASLWSWRSIVWLFAYCSVLTSGSGARAGAGLKKRLRLQQKGRLRQPCRIQAIIDTDDAY